MIQPVAGGLTNMLKWLVQVLRGRRAFKTRRGTCRIITSLQCHKIMRAMIAKRGNF